MSKMRKESRFIGLSVDQLGPILSDCIAQGQEVVLTITGHSMSPFLRNKKDQVVLTACDPTVLQPGDVPLYRRRNGKLILHRIVERDDGVTRTRFGETAAMPSCCENLEYTMLGDAQWQEEPHIAPDQILGVATAFISRGKRWECHSDAYRVNRLRWHRWLWLRPVLVRLYHLPRHVRYGIPYRLRRLLGRSKKK